MGNIFRIFWLATRPTVNLDRRMDISWVWNPTLGLSRQERA
jgi:hypothetical protein